MNTSKDWFERLVEQVKARQRENFQHCSNNTSNTGQKDCNTNFKQYGTNAPGEDHQQIPIIDLDKWLKESRELKGRFRSGREKRKGFIELAPIEYFFEVTDAKILKS